jgi:hypothetical protein
MVGGQIYWGDKLMKKVKIELTYPQAKALFYLADNSACQPIFYISNKGGVIK